MLETASESNLAAAPTRSDIERLQASMLSMRQASGLTTRHYFADGMYCRALTRPAGCTIVGKVHRKEHFYIVAAGEVTVTGDGLAPVRLKAPHVMVSAPGTKRATYAHVESTCITVHRVSSMDLEAIETELVEFEPAAAFGIGNAPKQIESDSR